MIILNDTQKKHIAEAQAIDPEFGLMIWALTVIDDLKRNDPYKRKVKKTVEYTKILKGCFASS